MLSYRKRTRRSIPDKAEQSPSTHFGIRFLETALIFLINEIFMTSSRYQNWSAKLSHLAYIVYYNFILL